MRPVDPKRGFELLVLFFESHGVAMENCGDHDFEVTCAFERAAGLIGKVLKKIKTESKENRSRLFAEPP